MIANVSNTKGDATVGVVRSVKCFYVSGLPVRLLSGLVSFSGAFRDSISGITINVSIQGNSKVSRVPRALRRLERGGFPCRVLFLSTRSRILMGQCGRAEHGRPLTNDRHVGGNVILRERGLRCLGSGTSCVVSADRLLAERLGVRLRGVFIRGRSCGGLFVAVLSFNFGCNVPSSSSVIVSIEFLPGPCCISKLHTGANGSGRVRSCIVRFPRTGRFVSGLSSVVGFLVPGCVSRNGGRLIVSVNYAKNGRHSMALTGRLCGELDNYGSCKLGVRRHSVKGSTLENGWRIVFR